MPKTAGQPDGLVGEDQRRKTVVVLGAARSGTSVTAGMLQVLGVDMGSIGPSKKWNPKGSFEDKDFQRLNRDIFRMVEEAKSYWNPPTLEQIMETRTRATPEIQRLVSEKSAGKSVWGWKNPRAILTMELFMPYLTNPCFVTVFRNPLATAKSSVAHHRGGIELFQALKLVNFYTEEMLAFLERHPRLPSVFVSFEDIVADPEKEAERLADFLDLELSEEKRANVYQLVIPRDRIEAAKEHGRRSFMQRLPRIIRRRLAGR